MSGIFNTKFEVHLLGGIYYSSYGHVVSEYTAYCHLHDGKTLTFVVAVYPSKFLGAYVPTWR